MGDLNSTSMSLTDTFQCTWSVQFNLKIAGDPATDPSIRHIRQKKLTSPQPQKRAADDDFKTMVGLNWVAIYYTEDCHYLAAD